jgi:hypothetical protein
MAPPPPLKTCEVPAKAETTKMSKSVFFIFILLSGKAGLLTGRKYTNTGFHHLTGINSIV